MIKINNGPHESWTSADIHSPYPQSRQPFLHTAENSDTGSNLAMDTQTHTAPSVEMSWVDKLVLGIFIAIVVGTSFTILIFLIYGRHAAFVAGIFVGGVMVLGAIIMSIIDTSNDDSKWRKNDSRT